MFGLFKKTHWDLKGDAYYFFWHVFRQLPEEYKFLLLGLEKGLYRRFSVNHAMKGHHFSIGFDPSQSDKSMLKGRTFELTGIRIIHGGSAHPLSLIVFDGLWSGFEFEQNVLDFKQIQVDVSQMRKDTSRYEPDKEIAKLVSGLSSEHLELENLFTIEFDGNVFYQLKDLENGNYIAMDAKGLVWGLIHDPFQLDLIHEYVRKFVAEVNAGKFNFEEYLEGRFSGSDEGEPELFEPVTPHEDERQFHSYVYFALFGDNFDPEVISARLELQPSDSWRKGDHRKSGHPEQHAYWRLISQEDEALDMNLLVEEVLTPLFQKVEAINAVKSELGLDSVLEVVMWIDTEPSSSTPFLGHDRRTIEFLYRTNTHTDVDIYRFDSSEDDD
ncbi:MAG: DUF4279 domain-containing protein [Bacteroidia bacterium]